MQIGILEKFFINFMFFSSLLKLRWDILSLRRSILFEANFKKLLFKDEGPNVQKISILFHTLKISIPKIKSCM